MSDRQAAMKAKRDGINVAKHEAIRRVIATMVQEQDTALGNLSEVARRAGVHRNTMANYTAEIELARAQVAQRYLSGSQGKAAVTVASIRADHEVVKTRLAQVERENVALRKRLGVQLGQEAVASDPSVDYTPELVALRNRADTLQVQVTELEGELHTTREELDAARRTNRRLMVQQNSTTGAA